MAAGKGGVSFIGRLTYSGFVPDATPPAATPIPADIAPDILAPFFAPFTSLNRVGPSLSEKFTRLTGGTRVLDLLFHLPTGFIDRRARPTLAELARGAPEQIATIEAEIVRIEPPQTRKQPWRVVITDGTGFGEIVFFSEARVQRLAAGQRFIISGKAERFRDRVTFPHPDYMADVATPELVPPIEPSWPLTAGLYPSQLRGALIQALARIPPLPEWHDAALMRRESWPSFADALLALHAPRHMPPPQARARLAYDEIFAHQLAMAWQRRRARRRPGRQLTGDGALRAEALKRFGHHLTSAQTHVLAEIDADLAAPRKMLRLLQGDVGSGKTLVAIMAMLRAVEAGAQAALMAPTEILARQHHRTLTKICPVPVGLLTGSIKGVPRRNVLLGLQTGRIPIIVGTHALFQENVAFKNLALAIIDEQHRFGVDQRLSLGAKGEAADVLIMTATPIPRTLLLTQWGEMTVSRITDKPAGRQKIKTTLHASRMLPDVVDAIARALDRGDQVYWVCPLVSESMVLDVAAAEDRFATLRRRFGATVGLAHGQQESAIREAALADFSAGRTRLLVATTVVEVGVDVPAANVIVIEHAERFGLAQLHQLRGRVGRGAEASFCLLIHDDEIGETGKKRLTLLRDTDDGFVIADEDFRLRGGGDILGKRQSGLPAWRLADPVEHEGFLKMAAGDAALLLERDPKLASERGMAVRLLLRLFERGEALRSFSAG
jgi:ATP-dependent DNA helicase RecG